MPLAQQTSKDTLSASPGQVKARAEAQAEEDGRVRGRGWPSPLGTLPPEAVEPGQLAGRFVSKAGRIFSSDHLVTYGRGRQKAGCHSRSFTQNDMGPSRRWEPRPPWLPEQSSGGPGWPAGGAYDGQRGLREDQCFHLAKSLLQHTTSLNPISHICFVSQHIRLSILQHS